MVPQSIGCGMSRNHIAAATDAANERNSVPGNDPRRWRIQFNGRGSTGTMEADRPVMPSTLSEEAKREWRRVVPLLDEAGVLTKADRGAVIRYCETWAEWVEVNDRIKQTGTLIRRSRAGRRAAP